MNLVYNLDILSENDFRLDSDDRAFQYGDGLFETIRYENGRIWFWPDHFDRLSAGMAALTLLPAFTESTLYRSVLELLAANKLTDQVARVKIQVWRQAGGFYTPVGNGANLLITAKPGNSFAIIEKAKIGIYDTYYLSYSPVSTLKTLNALPYVLAGIAKQSDGFDDMILLDQAGNLAECIASNLFWYRDKTLFTPSLLTGCVNGIARRQLLRVAPAMGVTVSEGFYKPDALQPADGVFCANTFGVQWFRQVNDLVVTDEVLPGIEPESFLALLFAQFHS